MTVNQAPNKYTFVDLTAFGERTVLAIGSFGDKLVKWRHFNYEKNGTLNYSGDTIAEGPDGSVEGSFTYLHGYFGDKAYNYFSGGVIIRNGLASIMSGKGAYLKKDGRTKVVCDLTLLDTDPVKWDGGSPQFMR